MPVDLSDPNLDAIWHALSGDHRKIVQLLRSERPLARDVRDYLANLIEGKIKRTRGRRMSAFHASPFMAERLRLDLALQLANQRRGARSPKTSAKEAVAQLYGISGEALDRLLYPRTRKPRKTTR